MPRGGLQKFIEKSQNKFGDKFSYEGTEYTGSKKSLTFKCKIHDEEITITPESHYRSKNGGCKQCFADSYKSNTEDFIKKSKEKFPGRFDYSKADYVSSQTPITLICHEHGEFEIKPNYHFENKNGGCGKCYSDSTRNDQNGVIEEIKTIVAHVYPKRVYDFSRTIYIDASTYMDFSCKDHGNFKQTFNRIKTQKSFCPECGIERRVGNVLGRKLGPPRDLAKTTEQYIIEAKEKHGDKYEYTNTKYFGTAKKVEIACKKHGIFTPNALQHLYGSGCPKCSRVNKISKGEQEVFDFTQSLNTNLTPEQSNREILKGKELDIYIPEKNLAIEYNGIFWHSEFCGKDKDYHIDKTNTCKKEGVKLLHIFSSEWLLKQDIVKSIITTNLGIFNERIYARKTKVREIDEHLARNFLNDNHIQGNHGATVRLGLFHNDELVSVMTFGKSRFSKKYDYEMIRFANKLNTQVLGGASKLYKYFLKNYKPLSVVSYSDIRYFDGAIYPKLGFEYSHRSKPNYFYLQYTSDVLESRMKYQKHKLENILEVFDPQMTEWENMQINEYTRIWDCGNEVWVWKDEKYEEPKNEFK